MTDALKPEQRKRVAEAVTGNKHRIDECVPGKVVAFIPDYWWPSNKLWQWKALVTWLAEHTVCDIEWGIIQGSIRKGDIDDLEYRAYEILEAQDD